MIELFILGLLIGAFACGVWRDYEWKIWFFSGADMDNIPMPKSEIRRAQISAAVIKLKREMEDGK
jgi:hypothetical protein